MFETRTESVSRSVVFSPLAKAVLETVAEGVIVFDAEGRMMYANGVGRAALRRLGSEIGDRSETLLPELARLGGRVAPLRVGGLTVGEAVLLPADRGGQSLADREKQAIVDTLDKTGWRLAESARLLGISRTTLWRRLKAYGLHRDSRGGWADTA